jgi:hypothetical protein
MSKATIRRVVWSHFCLKCGQGCKSWRDAVNHANSFNTESRCETLMDKRNRRNIYI